jgi:hypothetical protein
MRQKFFSLILHIMHILAYPVTFGEQKGVIPKQPTILLGSTLQLLAS